MNRKTLARNGISGCRSCQNTRRSGRIETAPRGASTPPEGLTQHLKRQETG